MISVIIADDHNIFRRGVKQILNECNDRISVDAEAGSQDELLQNLSQRSFDVLILDISMPGSNGLDTLRTVHETYPKLKVIMLSMYPEEQYAVRALKAGASGYLTKETAGDQINDAILKVHSGQHYITPSVTELLTREVVKAQKGPRHAELSDRELEVFLLLVEGKPLKDISEKLELSVKTVSTYRTRILEKLQMTTNTDLIRYAYEHGFIDRK